MADEKKTYLINIESNLNKYAEEADKAAQKVAQLKVENDRLKASEKATGAEIEASNAALRNAQKEYNQSKKLVDLQTAANNSNTNSRKQLAAIVTLEQQRLGKLEGTIKLNTKGQRVLSDEYKKAVKNLRDAKDAVIAYDKAQSDGRSNIGRYGESVKGAFKSIGTSMLGFVSITALVVAGLAKLKEAFMQTEAGAKLFQQSSEILKTVFQGIVSGDNIKDILKNAILVNVAAQKMDEIRKGDRKDLVEIAKLETEIAMLNLQAVDTTKSKAEQMDLILQLQQKENDLIAFKKADLEEEIANVNERLLRRKNDTDLLNEQARLQAEIIRLESDHSIRMQTRLSGLMNAELAEAKRKKDLAEKEMQETKDKLTKEVEAWKASRDKIRSDIEADNEKKKQDQLDFEAWELERKLLNQENLLSIRESQHEYEFDLERARLRIQEQAEVSSAEKTGADISIIHGKYAAARKAIDEAEMNAKLNLAAGFAGNLAQIFGENTAIGKAAAIAQTTIATYQSATEAYKSLVGVPVVGPALAVAAAAAAVASGLANVKKIAAVKSGLPGDSSGAPTSISSVPMAQRMMAGQVAPSILSQPQLGQSQLNSVSGSLTVEQLTEAFKNLPAPITTIEDIEARQKSTNKIVSRAII